MSIIRDTYHWIFDDEADALEIEAKDPNFKDRARRLAYALRRGSPEAEVFRNQLRAAAKQVVSDLVGK